MPSALFTHLDNNIRDLITHLRNFAAVDVNDTDNQIKLRALHILIHAEIETYFEQLGLAIINAYDTNSLNRRQKSKLSYSVLCYGYATYNGELKSTVDRISSSVVKVKNSIANNHGIKTSNVLKILLPLAYPSASLDAIWLTTMDSFGAQRGNYAHNGMHKITHLIAFNYVDLQVINIIIPEIQIIDNYYVTHFGLT